MTAWRTIKVFVSSTFLDMHFERDHLVRSVFPRLIEELARYHIHLYPVDLRWGITDAESRRALDICMDVLEDCRPFFLGLIGGRYGWIPLPTDLPRFTAEQFIGRADAELSAAFSACYRYDTISDCFRLRSAITDTSLPSPEVAQAASEALLLKAFEANGIADAGRSITEMEVTRALLRPYEQITDNRFAALLKLVAHRDRRQLDAAYVADITTGVRRLRRDLTGKQRATVEALLKDRTPLVAESRFFFRNPDVTAALPQQIYGEVNVEGERKLAALKSMITGEQARRGLPAPFLYSAVPELAEDGTTRITGLEAFGERVYAELLSAILVRHAENPMQDGSEAAGRAAFIERRTREFVGRENEIQRMLALIAGAHSRDASGAVICVHGDPGSGKSALMAELFRRLDQAQSGSCLCATFIGATRESSETDLVVRDLLQQLGQTGELAELPSAAESSEAIFVKALAATAKKRPVIVLIDAINQLKSKGAKRPLHWLPLDPPTNVVIVLSTLPGTLLEGLKGTLDAGAFLELGVLPEQQAGQLARNFLAARSKKMSEPELQKLLSHEAAGSPLYLSVALEELTLVGRFGALGQQIAGLPATIAALFDAVLARLEADHGARHVTAVMAGIGLARGGMADSDIVKLVEAETQATFPEAQWARLRAAIRPYLFERGDAIDFFHDQLRQAVERRYLSDSARVLDHHRSIVTVLAPQVYDDVFESEQPAMPPVPRPSALRELPYHLTLAEYWQSLAYCLADLAFLEAKARAGQLRLLADDFQFALDAAPRTMPKNIEVTQSDGLPASHRLLELIGRSIRRHAGFLERFPNALFQILYNDLYWVDCPERAMHLRHGPLPQLLDVQLATAEDGSVSPLPSSTVRALTEDKLRPVLPDATAAGGIVSTLVGTWRQKVEQRGDPWLRSKRPPAEPLDGALVRSFVGVTADIHDLAFSRDGRSLASASRDWTRIWDVDTGAIVVQARLFTTGLMFHPDDRRLLAFKDAKKEQAYYFDLETGVLRPDRHDYGAPFVFPPDSRVAAPEVFRDLERRFPNGLPGTIKEHGWRRRFSPDGQLVLGLDDNAVTIFHADTGDPVTMFRGHHDRVWDAAFSNDSRLVASASQDGTLQVWSSASGESIATLRLGSPVTCVDFSADGQRTACGQLSGDVRKTATIHIWPFHNGTATTQFAAHEAFIAVVRFSPDGRMLVSGTGHPDLDESASGGEIRLWDLNGETRTYDVMSHGAGLDCRSMGFARDGAWLMTTSKLDTFVWDVATGVAVARLPGNALRQPGHERLACHDSDGPGILLADLDEPGRSVLIPNGASKVQEKSFSRDGKRLLVASGEASLAVLDGTTGRRVTEIAQSGARMLAPAFSPGGRFVIDYSSNSDGVTVWSACDGKMVHSTGAVDVLSLQPSFAPDDAIAALPAATSTAMSIVNLISGGRKIIKGLKYVPDMVAFTADGAYAICAGHSGIHAWSSQNGRRAGWLAWPSELVGISNDGKWLAAISKVVDHSGRHSVRLVHMKYLTNLPSRWFAGWLSRLKILRPAQVFLAGPGAAEAVQFSDDGSVVSVRFWGSRAKLGRIEIWHLGTLAPLKAFDYQTGVIDVEGGWSGLSAARPAWIAYGNRNEIILDRVGSDGPIAAIPGNPSGTLLSIGNGSLHLACVCRDGSLGLYELAGSPTP